MTVAAGTELTCANDDCPCRLTVDEPCPHGDDYTCGCGHPLQPREARPAPPSPGE